MPVRVRPRAPTINLMQFNSIQSTKKIIIIGAGVSGLTAGIYALQRGFDVTILEKNPIVGGLCTGWYRQGRHIDGCIHWLTGTKEDTILNDMWKNVGAFKDQNDLIYLPSWGTFDYNGTKVTMWRDLKRAEKEWCEISPVDTKRIKKFFKMVRDFTTIELPLDMPINWIPLNRLLKLGFRVLNIWPSYLKTMLISKKSYAKRFKSPAIRFALMNAQQGCGNLFSMIYSYATVAAGDGGIPKGGSLQMVQRMKEKFISLGGDLRLNSEAKRIIVENKVAKGVLLLDGKKLPADYVVSCLDPHYTTHDLLFGEYVIKELERRYKEPKVHQAPSCVYVSLEIDDELKDLPIPYSFVCDKYSVGNKEFSHLTIRSYAYDKETFVKNGKTIMTIILDQASDDFNYWVKLYRNKDEYYQEKERLGKLVSSLIEKQLPYLNGKIKVLDVATPMTYKRYTNNTRGAYMGYLLRHDKPGFVHSNKCRIKNLYLSSQWMQSPGGLPLALSQGRFAIQRICRKNNLSYIFTPRHLTHKKTF